MIRPPRSGPTRRGLAALALAGAATFGLASAGSAQTPSTWGYEQDLHLTYEFDDNVSEEIVDRVQAQVAKVSYEGDLEWAGGEQRLSFSYAGGFKRHFDVADPGARPGEEVEISSQFINQGSLEYLRRMTDDLGLRGRVGVKNREWTDDKFFFLNEDAFTQYSVEVGGQIGLEPIVGDRTARLMAGLRYSDTEFENLDQFFGNWSRGGFVTVAKEFDRSLEVRGTYSFDQVRYPGRGRLLPGDEATDITGTARPRQEDLFHEVGAEVEWFGPIAVIAEYRLRFTDSNSFGFDNYSHNVSLLAGHHLPWGVLLQGYAHVELRSFTEPPIRGSAVGGSLDLGDAEDNVLLLRVVKDLAEHYSVEARYARYRNESLALNDFYTKNIWAVGVTVRP